MYVHIICMLYTLYAYALPVLLTNPALRLHEYYNKGESCMHKFPIKTVLLHKLFLHMEMLLPG